MCMVKVYKGKVSEETKLCDDVSRYELDLANRVLKTYSILGKEQTFPLDECIKWDESDDTLVI